MKFGQVTDPSQIDFTIPPSPDRTIQLLQRYKNDEPLAIFIGCAKWTRADLKGFYPRGTKDELTYYATQFNAIELNATFYSSPSKQQVETWRDKTPADFKFFPKIPQSISHYSRLLRTDEKVEAFVDATVLFEDKLGMAFLQMIENFKPKNIDRLAEFLHKFPKGYPLSVEVRNQEWFTPEIAETYFLLLEENKMTNTIVDTPGRRDMLHMRLTSPTAFVRFVSANHALDYKRLDEWITTIVQWKEAGLQQLNFFIHQKIDVETPLLAAYFIENLNLALGSTIYIPQKTVNSGSIHI